jgi:hypothetical protein
MSAEITPFPAFFRLIVSGRETSVYLYAGIEGIVEQYVAYLGDVQTSDDLGQVQAGAKALYEQWKQPKKQR